MLTFNNNPELKKELIETLKHHRELDAYIQGQWLDVNSGKIEGNGFRGCFYGCTMQTAEEPILKFSEKYFIDLGIVSISEKIFEGLPIDQAKLFPLDLMQAVQVGVDLNIIKSKWNTILLTDQLRFVGKGSEQEKAINLVISLFDRPFNEIVESAAESAAWSAESAAESAAIAARSAAWSARSAARSAAESAAESAAIAARSAAWSARSAAESAARSAESAAWSARSAYYVWMKDEFIKLFK